MMHKLLILKILEVNLNKNTWKENDFADKSNIQVEALIIKGGRYIGREGKYINICITLEEAQKRLVWL